MKKRAVIYTFLITVCACALVVFSGCMACKWMIAFVKKCKLIYFAIYCAIVGVIALYFGV